MEDQDPLGPFAGLRVLEVSEDPTGDLVGKLLSDLGAEVVKIEAGDRPGLRDVGPFAGDVPGPDRSLSFAYYNAGKKSVRIADGEVPLEVAASMAAEVDLLVTTCHPADYGEDLVARYEALLAEHRQLIVVSVTPFGLTGPWKAYRAGDLVSLALGGPLIMCGYDDLELAPVTPGGDQGYHTGSSFAFAGALYALIEREASGQGQLVDVARHDALAVTIEMAFPYWHYQQAPVRRQTCRHAQPTLTQPALFKALDEKYVYLVLIINEPKAWKSMVDWLAAHGLAADLQEPRFDDPQIRQAEFQHIQGIVDAFMAVTPSDVLFREGQQIGLPIGVVNAPEDLFTDPHLVERSFFQDVDSSSLGPLRLPGPPYRFSSYEWRIQGGPPPASGSPDLPVWVSV